MSEDIVAATPMTRYVLAATAVLIALLVVALVVVYFFDPPIPNSTGQITTLVSTMSGVFWFCSRVNRPMSHVERWRYSTGVTLVNLVVPVAYFAIVALMYGLPISVEGFDLLFGGGQGYLTASVLLFLSGAILTLTFIQAYFFAWLLTKKLPRHS